MDGIQELIDYLYWILAIGCTVKTMGILFVALQEENKEPHFKKIKNIFVFFVIAISLTAILDLATAYIGSL